MRPWGMSAALEGSSIPESHDGLDRQGVRPSCMFRAVRECQVLAGTITLGDVRRGDMRAILSADVPPVANELERYVLAGLLASFGARS